MATFVNNSYAIPDNLGKSVDDSDDLDAIHIVAADKSYDDLDMGLDLGKGQSKSQAKGQSSSEDQRLSYREEKRNERREGQRARHSRDRKKRSNKGQPPNLQEFEAMLMSQGYLDSSLEGALCNSHNGMSPDELQRHLAATPGGGQFFMDLAGNIKRVSENVFLSRIPIN